LKWNAVKGAFQPASVDRLEDVDGWWQEDATIWTERNRDRLRELGAHGTPHQKAFVKALLNPKRTSA